MFAILVPLALTAAGVLPAYRVEPLDLTGLDHDGRMMVSAFAEIGKLAPGEGYPIGAVVAIGDEIIGRGANHVFVTGDPRLHAEAVAIREAIATMRRRSPHLKHQQLLEGATIYVTLEPCPMDAGTIVLLRVRRVVLCDLDRQWGALGTVTKPGDLPHRVQVDRSGLPYCSRDRDGGPSESPAEIGRRAAQATDQVPSLASYFLRRLIVKARPKL